MNKLLMRFGNKKLGDDTAILNINSFVDCPSKKLGLCEVCGCCYAGKAEKLYPQVLPFRRKQQVQWDENTAEELAMKIRDTVERRRKATRYLRFQEAGDFRDQKDVVKMSGIADELGGVLKCYTYTHRRDLDFSDVSWNLAVNGSGFRVHNEFTVVPKDVGAGDLEGFDHVCGGDCRDCDACKSRNGLRIAVRRH